MRFPLSWLKEYVDTDLTPQQIASLLTLGGIEVERVECSALPFRDVVVAQVLRCSPHPNADRLRLAHVSNGKDVFEVVCGAPNCREGLHTAFARVGATLIDEKGGAFEIGKRVIRGVESQGMLCSEKELCLSEESDGILELPSTIPLGTDVATLLSDVIFEVSVTPNLGHCLSIVGIARELAALAQCKLKRQLFALTENATHDPSHLIRVEIRDQKHCLQYMCRILEDVTVLPSPFWIKRRIEACGLKSVNQFVDIANLSFLEYGQPLHLFDYDQIAEQTIYVESGTRFTHMHALNGITYDIPPDALLITDGEKPLAFAGVIGSEQSAVSSSTRRILIEAAHFTPQAVHRMSKQLKLRTDASYTFERGIDPAGVKVALDRAAALLQQGTGCSVTRGALDPLLYPIVPRRIAIDAKRINALLGTSLSLREMLDLLERLEIRALWEEGTAAELQIPTWRGDLHIEADIAEEIARLYGYNQIPDCAPHHISSTMRPAPLHLLEQEVRTRLVADGLQECITCDLISPKMAQLALETSLGPRSTIALLNPYSEEFSILRPSLLPGLLQVALHNRRHQLHDAALFEIGRVHFQEAGACCEQSAVAILWTGLDAPHTWDRTDREVDLFDLKGIVETLLQALRMPAPTFEPSHLHVFHPSRQASVKVGHIQLGAIGELHPGRIAEGVAQRLYFAQLTLQELLPLQRTEWYVQALAVYPSTTRDWTITLQEQMPIARVLHILQDLKPPLLESIRLLYLYQDPSIGTDKKNATFRLTYRDTYRTIDLPTAEREHANFTQVVAEKLQTTVL